MLAVMEVCVCKVGLKGVCLREMEMEKLEDECSIGMFGEV
jgi:hypothetical protein